MHNLKRFLSHTNPRFHCKGCNCDDELIVDVRHDAGEAATQKELNELKTISKREYTNLCNFYSAFNGIAFHCNGETAGLIICPISELPQINKDWREWFLGWPKDQQFEFQVDGFAFATIHQSGNYFVMKDGNIYYGVHDGGDDSIIAHGMDEFINQYISDSPNFLFNAGCYTRYYDGRTRIQYIPEMYTHGDND